LLIFILGGNLGYQIILSLIPSIIFTALYSQIRGYLWGIENYFAVSIVEFVEQILRIVFCMIFVSLKLFSSPVISVGVALSIACGLSTLYGYILYFKNNDFNRNILLNYNSNRKL
jgi:O-antigen/teichoic acid export membrane protein